MNKKKEKFPSELRYDVASKDWVVIATARAKRPNMFKKEKEERKRTPKDKCPFCKIKTQEKPTLVFAEGKRVKTDKAEDIPDNWTTVSFFNKYPAFITDGEIEEKKVGPLYKKVKASGFHEVVATRDHDQPMGMLPLKRVEELIEVYWTRYKDLMDEKFVRYIAIFQNHGPKAGASVYHPHSQIITTPLIDTDLRTALRNSEKYYQENKSCVYCEMIRYEMKVRERVVYENEEFLVLCPFASKAAFQMIVTPKKHSAYFHKANKKTRKMLADAFKEALSKLYKGLGDPDYNFYLHSAPCDEEKHPYYHWHWTILPKTSILAGFELGSDMEISTIEPEKAAQYLKNQ